MYQIKSQTILIVYNAAIKLALLTLQTLSGVFSL